MPAIVAAPQVIVVVSRPLRADGSCQQDLVLCKFGLCPVVAGEQPSLGPALCVTGAACEYGKEARLAIYDQHSDTVVLSVPGGLLEMDSNNAVTVLAGDPSGGTCKEPRDGFGSTARFGTVVSMATDGSGMLYVMDIYQEGQPRLRRVQRSATDTSCYVSTVSAAITCGGRALAYNPITNTLLFSSTNTTLSKLSLLDRGAMPVAGIAASKDPVDGPARVARFGNIQDMAIDDAGNCFILDGGMLRVMRPNGTVSTLIQGICGAGTGTGLTRISLLAGGRLALWAWAQNDVLLTQIYDTRLAPPPGSSDEAATAAADAVASGTGALAMADVTLVAAGGRAFPAHRVILSARCPYFRRLFCGGFADSASREVHMPEADPDALAALLRCLYTGSAGHPPPPTHVLQALAELADQLLLPELCVHVQAMLLRSVSAANVVERMLWADQAGGGMEPLRRRLEAFWADHRAEVADQAPASLDELVASGSPGLIKRLLMRGAV